MSLFLKGILLIVLFKSGSTHGIWLLNFWSLIFCNRTGGRAFEGFPRGEKLLRNLEVPERGFKSQSHESVSMLRPNSEK